MPEIWPIRIATISYASIRKRGARDTKFAYVPFGGGAHMCLGLNFASMQAKCFSWHFLNNVGVSIPLLQTIAPSGACGQFRIHATDYR